MTATISSKDLDRAPKRAQKAAAEGPVFVTGDGRTTHVLLSVEDYRCITGQSSIVDALAMPGLAGIEFDPPRSRDLVRDDFF